MIAHPAYKFYGQWPFCLAALANRKLRGWTGARGWGEAGIRGKGGRDGVKGMGEEGAGNGGRGGAEREILGRGLYQNLLYFTDFTLFLCTSMQ